MNLSEGFLSYGVGGRGSPLLPGPPEADPRLPRGPCVPPARRAGLTRGSLMPVMRSSGRSNTRKAARLAV